MPDAGSRGLAAALALVLATAAGCASTPTPAPTSSPTVTAPAVVSSCRIDPTWQAVPGAAVDAAQKGAGPTVVFANDSENLACAWFDLGDELAAHGRRVVVFTYGTTSADGEPQALRELLDLASSTSGTDPYALVGASLGGRLVLEAAATRPARLRSVVSLSGERTVYDYRDILPDARRVSVPLLYVGSREDPLTDGTRQPRELHDAVHGRPDRLLLLDGLDHGTDLLDRPLGGGRTTSTTITAFLDETLR